MNVIELNIYLTGARIRRGYRFPFGGWLELRHSESGKFGLLFIRKDGKMKLLVSPMLPKVNAGWCSAVENYTIKNVIAEENKILFALHRRDNERYLIVEQYAGGRIIVTDASANVLWASRGGKGASAGDCYKLPEELRQSLDYTELNRIDAVTFDAALSNGMSEFNSVWAELISREVRRKLGRKLSSLKRTLVAIRKDYEKLSDPRELRRKADIIMANLTSIQRGQNVAIVVDPYTGETIELQLDARVSPAKYADKLYARARRASRGRKKVVKRYREVLREMRRLIRISELADIDRASAELGIDKLQLLGEQPTVKTVHRADVRHKGIRRFTSSDGFVILVGSNADANNRLTFHIATKNDIWLHAEGVKGAHTIIRTAGKNDVPQNTIKQAAAIAAFYSDSKHSSLVPVVYTIRKYVHPIKKSVGKVRLDRYDVIMVSPCKNPKNIHKVK